MKNNNNIFIVIGVAVLLAVGIAINYYQEQNQVMLDDDGNPIPKATSPTAPPPAAPPTAAPAATSPKSVTSASLPSEETIGNPKATTTVGFGYTMDPKTEADPSKAQAVLSSVTQWAMGHRDAKVKVVLVDLPKDALSDPTDAKIPLGLSVNGKPLPGLAINPGESQLTPDVATSALKSVK